jgi:molybdopterin synthase catalytic subunit
MKVRVLFFATIRSLIGQKELEVNVPEGTTIAELKAILGKKYPEADPALSTMLAAVNREFSDDETEIPENAEVAFFPHVSGG